MSKVWTKSPAAGFVSSPFGPRVNPITGEGSEAHIGVDIAAPVGTFVLSPVAGVVHRSWVDGVNGQILQVKDHSGLVHAFGHLSARLVRKGEQVTEGQIIAKVGNTGRSTGPHLHYGVKRQMPSGRWTWIDPMRWVVTTGDGAGLPLLALAMAGVVLG